MNRTVLLLVLLALSVTACKKEEVVFTDNTAPSYDGVPTVRVNNYVNRLFIDLIGREPLDAEMEAEVATLEDASLSMDARSELVNMLMTNTDFLDGDSSYTHAYHFKVYNDLKARMIEGASEGVLNGYYQLFYGQSVVDSINGDIEAMQRNRKDANRILAIMTSGEELRLGEITIREMHSRLCNNVVYDIINMGSFNFVNATFSDLFDRYPTTEEFDNGYQVIEFNEPAALFGVVMQNKGDYLAVLTQSAEFDEGLVRYAYKGLLSREATSVEVFTTLLDLEELTLGAVQAPILISDEYAGF